jgi:hypothetical protein
MVELAAWGPTGGPGRARPTGGTGHAGNAQRQTEGDEQAGGGRRKGGGGSSPSLISSESRQAVPPLKL